MFEKVAYSYITLYDSAFILENKLYKEILNMDNQQPSSKIEWRFAEGSTTKYSRKPSESVRDSLDKSKDEDIVSTLSES